MRLLIRWASRLVWKLAISLNLKEFIIKSVGNNPMITWTYNRTVGILQTKKPITINGYKMNISQEGDRGGWIGANILVKGEYEPYTTYLFKQILKEGMVAVDVGAHIGYFTLLSASLVGGTGKVYAFEPEAENFSALLGNIVLNGFQNIKPFQHAVFSRSGKKRLYLGIHSGMHSLFKVKDTTSKSVMVDMVSLDDVFKKTIVDLVKVDTQGAELDVLVGMQKLIKRNDNLKLIIEFQEFEGVYLRRLWNKLVDSGFDFIYVIDENRGRIEKADYKYAVDFCKMNRIDGCNLLCSKQPFEEV